MGKYIQIDKTGEVLMVTSWKDMKGGDWKDNSKLIENKIMPFLE